MNPRRILQFAALAALALAAPTAAQLPKPRVPDQVGKHVVFAWERVAGTERSEVFRYRAAASFNADVFFATRDGDYNPDREIALFSQLNAYYLQRGELSAFEVVRDSAFVAASDPPAGVEVIATMERQQQKFVSYMYLFPLGPELLKVRITVPAGKRHDADVRAFITGLASEVQLRNLVY